MKTRNCPVNQNNVCNKAEHIDGKSENFLTGKGWFCPLKELNDWYNTAKSAEAANSVKDASFFSRHI